MGRRVETAAMRGRTLGYLRDLSARHRELTEKNASLSAGVDATRLDRCGWGVIHTGNSAALSGLSRLLAHRKRQAGAEVGSRYRELVYKAGESGLELLLRYNTSPGGVIPERVPYYLLLVGDPSEIPYEVQYELGVRYAVGRVHFATESEYGNYAENVLSVEEGRVVPPYTGFVGAVRNGRDPATAQAEQDLVGGLLHELYGEASQLGWRLDSCQASQSTQQALIERLSGGERSALVFLASHGALFSPGDPRQLTHQGAPVCADWTRPIPNAAVIPDSCLLTGRELPPTADVRGLILFSFGCYGAGTPQRSEYVFPLGEPEVDIAPIPFVSGLAQALLGREHGALALLGHVERAWSTSFEWPGADPMVLHFRESLRRLLTGAPLGLAMEPLSTRLAEISASFLAKLMKFRLGGRTNRVSEEELGTLWLAHNDARGYVIVGDPAVRLASPRRSP
jgi:hypothetical protein